MESLKLVVGWYSLLLGKSIHFPSSCHPILLDGLTVPSPTTLRQLVNPLIDLPSRPGETLPAFPAPTHINNPQTIASTISNIPPNAPNHHPKDLPYPKRPYDANNPLRSLIATAGGDDNYHPSGHRGFTEREFACLQTFPRGEWC
jgi:hypothetical protein